jgi:hypothetical protein
LKHRRCANFKRAPCYHRAHDIYVDRRPNGPPASR